MRESHSGISASSTCVGGGAGDSGGKISFAHGAALLTKGIVEVRLLLSVAGHGVIRVKRICASSSLNAPLEGSCSSAMDVGV